MKSVRSSLHLISLAVTPTHFSFTLWQSSSTPIFPLNLTQYKEYNNSALQTDIILYNPALLKSYLNSFIKEYTSGNPYLIISLQGAPVESQYIYSAQPTLTLPPDQYCVIEQQRLGSTPDERFLFYVAAIPYYIILQYQLVAQQCNANLLKISTFENSYLQAYYLLHKEQFRPAQLIQDILTYNNLLSFFTSQRIKELVHLSDHIVQTTATIPLVVHGGNTLTEYYRRPV